MDFSLATASALPVTWASLFERAAVHEVTAAAVREALADRRASDAAAAGGDGGDAREDADG